MKDNEKHEAIKEMIYDSFLEGTIQGANLFYEFLDKIYEKKQDDFVLRREDLKLLIDVYNEMFIDENKKIRVC